MSYKIEVLKTCIKAMIFSKNLTYKYDFFGILSMLIQLPETLNTINIRKP